MDDFASNRGMQRGGDNSREDDVGGWHTHTHLLYGIFPGHAILIQYIPLGRPSKPRAGPIVIGLHALCVTVNVSVDIMEDKTTGSETNPTFLKRLKKWTTKNHHKSTIQNNFNFGWPMSRKPPQQQQQMPQQQTGSFRLILAVPVSLSQL
jgi:hypothetical protein